MVKLMKNNHLNRTLKGNITIEASIVVPFMLVVLTSLLLTSIILHDVYVIKTFNTLKADAWVIAGEESNLDISEITVIIKPKTTYAQLDEKIASTDQYKSVVVGSGNISIFNVLFDAGDVRDYKVKNPKSFVRGIDFVDDATDMWVESRVIKESTKKKVEEIEDILKGN